MTCRKFIEDVKTAKFHDCGRSFVATCLRTKRHPAYRVLELANEAEMRNVGTCRPDANGEAQVETPRGESTEAGHRGGTTRSSDEVLEIRMERRGCGKGLPKLVNQQWEEPMNAAKLQTRANETVFWFLVRSRMNREVHVRFWESVGVKLPRATHQRIPPRLRIVKNTLTRTFNFQRPTLTVGRVHSRFFASMLENQ